MPEVGIIVLAAGNSSRMGRPKQLLDFGGQPLVRHAVEAALASVCRPLVVVCGAYADEVSEVLRTLPVTVVRNPNWERGMGGSIQAGISALPRSVDALILTLADQPLLTPQIYDRLVETYRTSGKPIVSAKYSGTVGVPVLFSREYFPHLLSLAPDQGCKGVILRNADHATYIDCPEAAADVDTPSDFERLLASERGSPAV